MALTDLAIFSGLATIVVSSSAGYLHINETRKTELKSKRVVHKLKPTFQQKQYGVDYSFKSSLTRTDMSLFASLSQSWDERVDIWAYGANSVHKLENVFLNVEEKRVFQKGKATHEFTIQASTNDISKVLGWTPNLASITGSFQNDTNADGVADGVTYGGSGTPTVEAGAATFASGNLQKIANWGIGAGEKITLFEKEFPIQGSRNYYVSSFNFLANTSANVTCSFIVKDEVGGAQLQKIDVFHSVGNNEVTLSSRFLPEITASTTQSGVIAIELQTDTQITVEIDNHNLSLNHDFEFRDY